MVWISSITKQYNLTLQFKDEMIFPKDLLNNSHVYFELNVLEPDPTVGEHFHHKTKSKRLLENLDNNDLEVFLEKM